MTELPSKRFVTEETLGEALDALPPSGGSVTKDAVIATGLAAGDIGAQPAGNYAPIASPHFTGTPLVNGAPIGSVTGVVLLADDDPDPLAPVAGTVYLRLAPTSEPVGDTTAPSTPTGLVASAITDTGFHLAWTASTDNAAVAGYNVYLDGTLAGGTLTNSYDATGLSTGTSFAVTVRARDTSNNLSGFSEPLTVATSSAGGGGGEVLRYGFNEASGSAILDGSGNGNDGVLNANAVRVTGQSGSGFAAARSNDDGSIKETAFVTLATVIPVDADGLSVALWFYKPTNRPGPLVRMGTATSFNRELATDDVYSLQIDDRDGSNIASIQTEVRPADGGNYRRAPKGLAPGAWNHLGVCWNRIAGVWRIYYNGVNVLDDQNDGWKGVMKYPITHIQIGNPYNGPVFEELRVDDLHIWRREASAGEIAAAMNTPVA